MKHHSYRRTLCLLLSILMLLTALTGCSGRDRDGDKERSPSRRTEEREETRKETKKETKKEVKEEKRETEAPAKTRKANELPSFLDFTDGDDFEVSQMDTHDGYFSIVYRSESGGDFACAQDYISMLLEEENCKIVVEDGKDRDDWYLKKLLLDHPADASKHRMDALDDFWDNKGDLFISLNYYKDDGVVTFNISYSEDLEIPDKGEVPPPNPTNPWEEKDCWWCGGDGRCNECGGDGRVSNWLAGTTTYVDQNCTNCNGGRCRQCGGDGKG